MPPAGILPYSGRLRKRAPHVVQSYNRKTLLTSKKEKPTESRRKTSVVVLPGTLTIFSLTNHKVTKNTYSCIAWLLSANGEG